METERDYKQDCSYENHTYHVGEFVYVEPSEPNLKPHIVCIERLWEDEEGKTQHTQANNKHEKCVSVEFGLSPSSINQLIDVSHPLTEDWRLRNTNMRMYRSVHVTFSMGKL